MSNTLAGPNPVQQSPTEHTAGGLYTAEPGDEVVTPVPRSPVALPVSDDHDPVELRAALSALRSEFSAYGVVVKRMATACAEEQEARSALNNRVEQLFTRLNQDTNKS